MESQARVPPRRDAYAGPDRRRHRVYVTRNTEYHFRDGFCVAVRDRRTGDFLLGHLALRRRVQGSIRFTANGGIIPNPGTPKAGESLYFDADDRDLLTSPVERIDRPDKSIVAAYPTTAGTIRRRQKPQ